MLIAYLLDEYFFDIEYKMDIRGPKHHWLIGKVQKSTKLSTEFKQDKNIHDSAHFCIRFSCPWVLKPFFAVLLMHWTRVSYQTLGSSLKCSKEHQKERKFYSKVFFPISINQTWHGQLFPEKKYEEKFCYSEKWIELL